jgi:hypothetical protein
LLALTTFCCKDASGEFAAIVLKWSYFRTACGDLSSLLIVNHNDSLSQHRGVVMSGFRLSVLLAALSLSGCMMSDPPSRGQSPQSLLIEMSQASGYAVKAVNVVVPRSLVVSEANSYKPTADIVWHGDADGDRYGQVKTIVQGAMSRATQGMTQGRAVVLDVVVTKFHALTQKTRDSIGGKHNLFYTLSVRDAVTGQVLSTSKVNATVRGAGGATARTEEAVGRTQKVVITEALIVSLQQQLGPKSGGVWSMVSQSARKPALDLPK